MRLCSTPSTVSLMPHRTIDAPVAGSSPKASSRAPAMVSASPLTRSSHHAGEDFARLKAARLAQTGG